MSNSYTHEELHRLASEAHLRACRCPKTLEDWEERVADRCATRQDLLAAIQSIDLGCRCGRMNDRDGIALLRIIEDALAAS